MRRFLAVLGAAVLTGCGGATATVVSPPSTTGISVQREVVGDRTTDTAALGCPTDARVGPNGEVYVRDRGEMCAWVDAQGNVVPSSAQPEGTSPTTPGPGEMVVELLDAPQFIEGFNYGVQVQVGGDVLQELVLADFDLVVDGTKDGPYGEPSTWRATFEVPAGTAHLRSDLRGYDTEVPDFSAGCATSTDVASGDTALLRLNWESGCLEPA